MFSMLQFYFFAFVHLLIPRLLFLGVFMFCFLCVYVAHSLARPVDSVSRCEVETKSPKQLM
jgi:hypothetical protein